MAILLGDGSVFPHVPKTDGNGFSAVLAECVLIDRCLKVPHERADVDRVVEAIQSPAGPAEFACRST